MTTLFLIRHAHSLWQAKQSLSKDSDLSPLGVKQSLCLNNHIKNAFNNQLESSIIYVSPLKRAIQTAQKIGEKYTLNPNIKEASFHVASTLPQFEKTKIYQRTYSDNPEYQNFKTIVKTELEKIVSYHDRKNIFLYTHGGFIKTALRVFHDNDCVCYTINNCSITEISWYRNRWHIKYVNNNFFLPPDLVERNSYVE